jgi:predicted enzyme related to lactoylglutathione lyase
MDPVVHFEMPYEDNERVKKFYSTVFGWEMRSYGQEMGNYVTAATTEIDNDNMPLKAGAIGGGFYPMGQDMPKCPSVVIAVENLEKSIEQITSAGGTILGNPMEIPGIGIYVAMKDTEGNRVGVLQPFNMV